jgi:hypothetical protein
MQVIGWKVWCLDTSVTPRVPFVLTSRETDWEDLPDAVLYVMIYFDEISTSGRYHYRRGGMGQEFYWHDPVNDVYDTSVPGETREQIQAKHPDAIIKEGITANDDLYKAVALEASLDHNYTGMIGIE